MNAVAIRDLRNRTADVIKTVERGEVVTLTNRGRPIARIVPIEPAPRKPHWTIEELLSVPQTDPGMRDVLRAIGSDEQDWLERDRVERD